MTSFLRKLLGVVIVVLSLSPLSTYSPVLAQSPVDGSGCWPSGSLSINGAQMTWPSAPATVKRRITPGEVTAGSCPWAMARGPSPSIDSTRSPRRKPAAAAPEAPQFGDPLWGHAWPLLFAGQPGYGGATNLGRLLGLPGVFSLLPLLALWWWTWQQLRPQLRPA